MGLQPNVLQREKANFGTLIVPNGLHNWAMHLDAKKFDASWPSAKSAPKRWGIINSNHNG